MTGNNTFSPKFGILPQALPPAQGAAGRVFRVSYTALVSQTGLSCTGTADVCFSANGRTCAPFALTGVSLNALQCT